MKEKINKEYIKRLKAILKSKLNFGTTVKAINTWAVSVIRYSAGIVDWKNSELQYGQEDQKSITYVPSTAPKIKCR